MVNLQPGEHQQQQELSPDPLFSDEEIELISKCDSECFYHRSLPLSIIASILTYWAVRGYIPNWGLWPIVIASGLFGYMIGIYSYLDICEDRLMQLQDSNLRRISRKKKGKTNSEFVKGSVMAPIITSKTPDVEPTYYTDYESDTDSNLD